MKVSELNILLCFVTEVKRQWLTKTIKKISSMLSRCCSPIQFLTVSQILIAGQSDNAGNDCFVVLPFSCSGMKIFQVGRIALSHA
jgi:hypothetical protein